MTIRDLYEWAVENNYLDVTVAKHCNGEVFDIREVAFLDWTNIGLNGKVVID